MRRELTKDHLLAYFKRNWYRYIIGVMLVFVSTYFTVLIPRLIGQAIDLLDTGSALNEVTRVTMQIAGAAGATFVLRFIWRFLILGFCRGAETYLRQKLFAHLETLSADFYIKYNTGDIITRAISDVSGIRRMFGFGFISLIDALVIFSLASYNMVDSSGWAMSAIALAPIPILIYVVARMRRSLRQRMREIREATSNLASKVQENLTGIRVVKAFAQEDSECGEFDLLSRKRWKTEMSFVKLAGAIGPVIQATFAAVFMLFIIFGSRMVSGGDMSLGQFTAFNGYILLMVNPVANIGRVIELWQTGLASIARLDELFGCVPSVNDELADVDAAVTDGLIELKNLTFAYPGGPDVLKDVSITINPGETVAVTGPTGCGKTTLAALLARQWKIKQGMMFVDGCDINNIPVKTLRGAMGYVPQDNFLFSASIMDNILFYEENAGEEDVYAAAKAVSIHDNVMEFAAGYSTMVGERGMTLSGGQKQRVSIARALVRRPKILLLDDCLSAVDAETEHAIIEGLTDYLASVTAIIITHRVSAAALADRILVLSEDGRVAELGTYDQLMEKQGAFYSLVMQQTGKEDDCNG